MLMYWNKAAFVAKANRYSRRDCGSTAMSPAFMHP
jgi:hypothetical protein